MAAIRGINFDLVGDDNLRMFLAKFPKRVRDKIFARVFRNRLKVIRDAARANAPVLQDVGTLGSGSQGRIPGTLKRNIKTPKKFTGRGRLAVGVYIAQRESFGISGDSKWFYPAHVHYGHSVASTKTGNRPSAVSLYRYGVKIGLASRSKSHRPPGFARVVQKTRRRLLAMGAVEKSVAPRPFMRDAWIQHKSSIEAGIVSDLRAQLEAEAKMLADTGRQFTKSFIEGIVQ